MNRIVLLFSALSCALWATSCCPGPEEDFGNRLTIDPVEYPMFEFDEQGVPYQWEHPVLDEAMCQTIRREFFGHGWRWMQTNEINSEGRVVSEEYYRMFGASPTSYYLQSDSVLQGYLFSDAVGKCVFWEGRCRYDPSVGDLTCENSSSGDDDAMLYFRIWSVYQLNGRWYMLCVVPLCVRADDHGRYYQVWGTSQYVRMSDSELQEMQRQHSLQIR